MNTLLFAVIALTLIILILLKPRRRGQPHNRFFAALNTQLQDINLFRPAILLDLDALDQNIVHLKQMLNRNAAYRIPVKSLPCIELIDYVMRQSGSNKLMVFHQPFLTLVAQHFPRSDVLFGKPMPVGAARVFYQTFDDASSFVPCKQLQWLIDTQERLEQYLALAIELKQTMRVNIEIDVGLHRGGLLEPESLNAVLDVIDANSDYLVFSGFMGYDPHVVKLPRFIKSKSVAYQESQARYQAFIEVAKSHKANIDIDQLCLNGAGSPTLELHRNQTVCNDLTAGSCLVKPSDFDIETLSAMRAATFISTPVLKCRPGTWLPSGDKLASIIQAWNPNREQSFYIYGGKWMADFISPTGLIHNAIIGFSTNQQIVNGSSLVGLKPDDFVFLRPHQSECVFLQFGDIRTIRNGNISNDTWPVFPSEIV